MTTTRPFPKKPPTAAQQKAQSKRAPIFLVLSKQGYQTVSGTTDGKNIHWTTDVLTELPIQMEAGDGPASLQPLTVPQVFQKNMREDPKRIALQVERHNIWVKWTWKQYYDQAVDFGKALMSLQVVERTAVNIIGFNSPEWVISFIGAILANCIPAGVYTSNSPESCLYVAKHSDAQVIVVEDVKQLEKYEKVLDQLTNIKAFVVYNSNLPERRVADSRFMTWCQFLERGANLKEDSSFNIKERMNKQRPGMCCNLVYTSGTTGPPKGVMLSHDNLIWGASMASTFLAQELDLSNERVVSYLPLSHVAAQQNDIIGSLSVKALIVFARPDALQGSLVETMRKVKPTRFVGVPRVWEKFEERIKDVAAKKGKLAQKIGAWAKRIGYHATNNQLYGKNPPLCYSLANFVVFKNIKKALGLDHSILNIYGAAPLKKSTRDYFASLNIPLLNMYGMSETGGAETLSLPFPFWNKLDAAGVPLIGTHIKIEKQSSNSKQGQICFKGRNMFMGYLKNEEETKKTIDADGYVHSGDLGYIDGEGFLHITGRSKELIITAGGQNVAPVLIEDQLKENCPLLSNVMLIGDARKYLSAILTLKCRVDPTTGESHDQMTPQSIQIMKRQGVIDEAEAKSPKTASEYLIDDRVIKYLQKCVRTLNETGVISKAQQVRKWTLIPGDFSIAAGHLTPTMKLKRKVVAKMYEKEIQQMYMVPKL